MANRYWVGGSATWNGSNTSSWSAASPLSFTASCSGTTLTTVGSPPLVVGMSVFSSANAPVGDIMGGSGNTWTVSPGGTFASQTMKAATLGASVPTAADNVFFDANSSGSAAYTVTLSGSPTCLDFNGTGLTPTFAGTGTLSVAGSFTLATGSTWSNTGLITFTATTTGKTITTNGVSLACGINLSGVGGEWTLGSALTSTAAAAFTVTFGSFVTGNFNVTWSNNFSSSNANVRSISLGSSTLSIGGAWSLGTSTNLTFNAGTSQINMTAATASFTGGGQTFYNVAFTSTGLSASASILSTNTFNNLSATAPTGTGFRNLSFSGNQTINGTFSASGASEIRRIYIQSATIGAPISLTFASPQTLSNVDICDITAVTNSITATSSGSDRGGNTNITFSTPKTAYWNLAGTQNWSATGWATAPAGTPAAANFPLAQDTAVFTNTGSVGTVAFDSAWNIGTVDMSGRTSAMTLTFSTSAPNVLGNWLNGTGTTMSGTLTTTFAGRGNTQQISGNGRTFPQSITIANIGGTVQLISAVNMAPTATLTLTNGTLDLQSYTLTCGLFKGGTTATRAIAFGTGNITVNGTGSIWNTATTTNLSITGTPVVNVSNNTATASTVAVGAFSEASAISFNITAGTYTLTFLGTTGHAAKNVDFTGFAGTWGAYGSGAVIYGSLTLSSGMTLTANTNALIFGSTSGVETITTNGKTMNFPINFNGAGGTWQLQDALTQGSTRTLTLTNGTLDLNGKTLTVGSSFALGAGTKNITFNGGTIVATGSGASAFNAVVGTSGFTTTQGTAVGTLSFTSASAKTFGCGTNVVWYAKVVQAGAGALTISGTGSSGSLNDITATSLPSTITLASSTTTVVQNFTLSGTAGNLVTLNASTPGTQATLSDASGTISVSYVAIQDIAATGGASWNAPSSNGNVDNGNNTGWVFSSGTLYTGAVSEGLTSSDSLSIVATFAASASEGVTASDATAASLLISAGMSDALSAMQTASTVMAMAEAVNEQVASAFDTFYGSIYGVTLSEAITAADAAAAGMVYVASVSEGATSGFNPAGVMSFVNTYIEGAAASSVASVTQVMAAALIEQTAADALLNGGLIYAATLSDGAVAGSSFAYLYGPEGWFPQSANTETWNTEAIAAGAWTPVATQSTSWQAAD